MSDYNDFWFIEMRSQTKNLKRWTLWLVLFFIFVTICTVVCVKSMYSSMSNYEIKSELLKVTVEKAKSTNANGYIYGTVTNESNEEIKGKYIEFTFYTKNDIDIGKEYVEIGNLKPQETKTYETKFRYPNVERFVITISDEKK